MVWLLNPQRKRGLSPKLQRQWEGPYKVLKRINDVIYRIKKIPAGKPRVVHYNHLAPYSVEVDGNARTAVISENPNKDINKDPEFEAFMANYSGTGKARFGITKEVCQDLFEVPRVFSSSLCIWRSAHEQMNC